jgi:DNA (cytosine-5)-methyltransferase 1
MSRPKLIDPFCCAGGASMGYHRAGFDVVGIDLHPQPNYPFEFIQGDAIEYLSDLDFMSQFDAAAGSPPCQGYSRMTRCRPGLADEYPKLIDAVRDCYRTWGGPWIIENVEGSGLAGQDDLFGAYGVMLCSCMFGRELYRPRWFEASFPLPSPPYHPRHDKPASKAGHWKPGTVISIAGHFGPMELAREVMDIDWMTGNEMREAIPPYMTEYLGAALLEHLAAERAA